jgi:hypothetical protein
VRGSGCEPGCPTATPTPVSVVMPLTLVGWPVTGMYVPDSYPTPRLVDVVTRRPCSSFLRILSAPITRSYSIVREGIGWFRRLACLPLPSICRPYPLRRMASVPEARTGCGNAARLIRGGVVSNHDPYSTYNLAKGSCTSSLDLLRTVV